MGQETKKLGGKSPTSKHSAESHSQNSKHADPHNLDRGNLFGAGKGDGKITCAELLETLEQNGLPYKERIALKKTLPKEMTIEQADKIFTTELKKFELKKFGLAQADSKNQPLPEQHDGLNLSKLTAILNHADDGKGTGLFNLYGRKDGYLSTTEVHNLLERGLHRNLTEQEKKQNEDRVNPAGPGISIENLVKAAKENPSLVTSVSPTAIRVELNQLINEAKNIQKR